MYLEEGQAEGVRGDIAFMQSIIETGWFSFGGRVPPEANNFSGLGATDGTLSYATFAERAHWCARADPAPPRVRRRDGNVVHAASAAQRLRRSAVQPRVAEGQSADLEPVRLRRVGHRSGYSFKILVLYDTLLAPLGKPLA